MSRGGLILLSLGGLVACSSTPTSPGRELDVRFADVSWLQTEDGAKAKVTMTLENFGEKVTWVGRCGDRILLRVDRLEGLRWANQSAAVCPAVLPMNPLELGPGEMATQSLAFDEEGTYRVSVAVYASRQCESESGDQCLSVDGDISAALVVPANRS